MLFVDELVNNMAKGKQTDAVVMDFSKAFDIVPHGSLLSKLSYYGVRGSVLKWIDNFLLGRRQHVSVDGKLIVVIYSLLTIDTYMQLVFPHACTCL